MQGEIARDVWSQRTGGSLLPGIDKVDDPDAKAESASARKGWFSGH